MRNDVGKFNNNIQPRTTDKRLSAAVSILDEVIHKGLAHR